MAQQKQITLRNVKGSALTYVEMDRNLSSFFYSASLSGTDLLLHYTGSTVLGPDYTPSSISVPLNPLLTTITQLTVAGNFVGDIQYRINNTTLGANSSFKWDTNKSRLGVGVASPTATVHVLGNGEGSIVRLSASGPTKFSRTGYIDFATGGTFLGSFGKTRSNSDDIYTDLPLNSNLITTVASAGITRTNSTGLGIFTNTVNNALTVVGVIGVGTDISQNQGLIGSIVVPTSTGLLTKVNPLSLPTNTGTIGLLIESPKRTGSSGTGGHVVVGINATPTVQNTAFSVVAGGNGNYTTSILTATATGKIGINKPNPVEALDIVGNTVMTGTATIGTATDSQGANIQVLTRNSTSGLVQYSNNLMPKGGIIMWSGSPTALPTGWALCDGTGTVNGSPIPDLRERFIVGAGGNNTTTEVIDYDYNTLSLTGTFRFTDGSLTGQNIGITSALFTKVREDGLVTTGGVYVFPANSSGGNPNVIKQYAVYSNNTGIATTSFFIVWNLSINGYRLYRGILPTTTGTSLASISNYPYYDLPIGAQAVLKQVGNTLTYRPNWSPLFWQQNTAGYSVGDTGGFNHVELEISEMPSHTHTLKPNVWVVDTPPINAGGTGNDDTKRLNANNNDSVLATGNDFPHENRPPYYALAFIIYTGI